MALVITRKPGQSFWIGEAKVTVTKKDDSYNQFRVIIDAPKEISIRRDDMKKGVA